MEPLEQKVKKTLSNFFSEQALEIETFPGGRVSGFIVSDKFNNLGHLARQRMIWRLLRKKLTKSEQDKVLDFLAYTPEENEAYSNGAPYRVRRKPIKGLEKKVKNILSELFAEHELKLETEPDGRVSGFIISDQFLNMDIKDRIHVVRNLLRKKLTQPEQRQILGFLTFTPVEYEAYSTQSFY